MAKDKVITSTDAENEATEALRRVKGKTSREPVQAKLKSMATFEEPKVKLTKEEKAIKKAKDAVEKAEQKLKEKKQKLEEAKRLNKEKDIKKYEKEVSKAQAALKKAKNQLRKVKGDKPMDLRETAERAKKNEEKRKKAGMDDKKKDKDRKEKDPQKQNNNVRLASHINLPSGMRIRQDGPNYVLVTTDKAGNEHTTPVTDVINQIDRYNKNVDAQNASMKAFRPTSQAQNINPTNDAPTNGVNSNVQVNRAPTMPSASAPTVPTVPANELKGAEDIVAASDKFRPEDVQEVARAAMQLSKMGILRDPHALEELNKRKKKQDERTDARNRQIAENQVR